MTTGVLIFAFNNEHLDYLAMANWSAKNIRRHLGLPVCVVTNSLIPDNYHFEQRIYAEPEGRNNRRFWDLPESVTWFNGNRVDAYELSPWSRTLVLDADYVVASNQLKSLLTLDQDFLAHRTAYDITGLSDFTDLNYFGKCNMPMWWATVMMFRRSTQSKLIFDHMQMIRANWTHYKNLIGFTKATYRNDFALSIALNTVNGHTLDHPEIPWKLASLTHHHELTQVDVDTYRVNFKSKHEKPQWITVTGDFHAMGKRHLGDIIASNS